MNVILLVFKEFRDEREREACRQIKSYMTCAMRLVEKPEGPERRGTNSVEGNSAWRCGNGRGVARVELSMSLEHRVHGREGGEIMRGSRQSREGRQKLGHTGNYMLY